MRILSIDQYTRKLNEMAAAMRSAEEIGDFFRALEAKKGTIAWLYYGNDWSAYMPKRLEIDGIKQPNPMLGRLFKVSAYNFQVGKEYYDRLEQLFPGYMYDPNVPVNQEQTRDSGWVSMPDPAKPCVQSKKTGEVALPVVEPKTAWSKWIIIDDMGNTVEKEYDEISMYVKPPKPAGEKFHLDYKKFYVNKIYMLNSGGKTWKNRNDFLYPVLAPFFGK